ncbi:hypothetical protein SUGI_1009670 [Cryptomeria japonica]|uniref:probable inactive 2-oxoglutarate-dependent dioxygenase AOP2 n=1 Tax=Cryptomeria japonica TaxID=3369 RepID=UPI00241472B4|nr:probable inactive 2-oxoglutarate-dependent dioxygenase AOP2 [Cryptomeria japonica]GLJ47805.1 hypothetical protein SUGI_1009670 [Cryptomeria japonica]
MDSDTIIGQNEGEQVPVIDLSLLRESTYVEVRKACEEWGCFVVANHGVKEEIIDGMDSATRDAFALPKETRQKNAFPRRDFGYISDLPALPFYESLGVPGAPDRDAIQKFSDQLWPQGNSHICKIIQEYTSDVEELMIEIIKIIFRSFTISKYYESQFYALLRLNYYDIPPNKTGGVSPHADHDFITILYQDKNGGLEVQNKYGRWAKVKFMPNSFIVLMGDCMKAWSNGRIWNCIHRVIMKECETPRVSLPYFYYFSDEVVINAPPELIDENHPRLYKPFKYPEFRAFYGEMSYKKIQEFETLRNDTELPFIDMFALITIE